MTQELVDVNPLIIEEDKLDWSNSIFLGNGASGSVFTAKYFGIDVAVKVILKTNSGVANDLSDFYNELELLRSITQHSNIIRFFGLYNNPSKNSIGLVMELCSKGSLSNYISSHDLSFDEKVQFIKGIANGMQYLHYHNIAHRDLKCENVLLDASLTPKIIDFGYSRMIADDAMKSMNLTMNIGTAAYCAPEIIKSQTSSTISLMNEPELRSNTTLAYDKRCDVYSFAICIFVIYFQNSNPYGRRTGPQILMQLSANPNARPKYNESNIPPREEWLVNLMKLCWSTNPQDRPSFEQICSLLQNK